MKRVRSEEFVRQLRTAARCGIGTILRPPHLIDEVISETLDRVVSRVPPPDDPEAFAFKVAQNLALRVRRRESRFLPLMTDVVDDTQRSGLCSPDREVELRELARLTVSLLGLLDDVLLEEPGGEVVRLALEGLDFDEIADCLGATKAAARRRFYRCVDSLSVALYRRVQEDAVLAQFLAEVLASEEIFHDRFLRLLGVLRREGWGTLRIK